MGVTGFAVFWCWETGVHAHLRSPTSIFEYMRWNISPRFNTQNMTLTTGRLKPAVWTFCKPGMFDVVFTISFKDTRAILSQGEDIGFFIVILLRSFYSPSFKRPYVLRARILRASRLISILFGELWEWQQLQYPQMSNRERERERERERVRE